MPHWPRWSAEQSGRWGRLALWPAGLAAGLAAERYLYGWADPAGWVPDLLAGWAMIGCGLAGWACRPASRSGALLAAAGFAWFVPDFAGTGAGAIGWLGAHALYLHRGPLVQLFLTHPTGRIRGRAEGVAVAAGYAAAVVSPVWGSRAGTVALAVLLVAVAVGGYVRAAGRERRMRRSGLRATTLFAVGIAVIAAARWSVPTAATDPVTLLTYEALLCTLAVVVLTGLLRWPWERAEVADLVVELGEARSGTLRDELARALGDPSLHVGYWISEPVGFVDADGHPVPVPEPGSGRSATIVERDEQPVAVLVHDPAVLADPGLAEAVSSAPDIEPGAGRPRRFTWTRTLLPTWSWGPICLTRPDLLRRWRRPRPRPAGPATPGQPPRPGCPERQGADGGADHLPGRDKIAAVGGSHEDRSLEHLGQAGPGRRQRPGEVRHRIRLSAHVLSRPSLPRGFRPRPGQEP